MPPTVSQPVKLPASKRASLTRELHILMSDQIKDREAMNGYKQNCDIRSKALNKIMEQLAVDQEIYGDVRATRHSRKVASKVNPKKLMKKGVRLDVIEACTDVGKTSYSVKISRIKDSDDGDNEGEDDD